MSARPDTQQTGMPLEARSIGVIVWDVCVISASVFAAVAIPLNLAFAARDIHVESRIIQLVFALDFVLRLRAHFQKRAVRSVRWHEPTGWLVVDAIAALPIIWVWIAPLAGLSLVVKVFRIAHWMHQWRITAVQWGDALRLVFFAFWLFISAHWLACVWSTITPSYDSDGVTRYLQSIYWVIETLTTIGYGETTPTTNVQRMFAIVVMLCGVAVYGFVIGNVASMLAKRDPSKAQYFEQIDQLNAFLKYRSLPPETRRRIQDYYAHIWQERMGYDESTFVASLPGGLRREVQVHLKQEILRRIPIFAKLPMDFIEAVALSLKPDIYVPGDFICRLGEEGDRMYFIIKGELEVIKADGSIVGILRDGDFFGEVALFKQQPRNASVRANDYSDVYALDRSAFSVLLSQHPDVAEQLRTVADRRAGG